MAQEARAPRAPEMTAYAFPKSPDLFYRVAAGRADVQVIESNEHATAFHNPEPDPKFAVDVLVAPRVEILSLTHLDLSDASRWVGVWRTICQADRALGLGPQEGYRVEIPVHPPYQDAPWLTARIVRKADKKLHDGADADGWTRDIGHFEAVANGQRRTEVLYENDRALIFDNLDAEDHLKYDAVITAITRRPVATITGPDFTAEDWLALTAAVRQGAERAGLDAYRVYMNVRPPYQHTPWVHVHVVAGKKHKKKP